MPPGSVRTGRTFRVTYAHGGRDAVSWYVLPATTPGCLASFDAGTVRVVENGAARQVLEVPSLRRRIVVSTDSGVVLTLQPGDTP